MSRNVLIIGLGSIGTYHMKKLRQIGLTVYAVDSDKSKKSLCEFYYEKIEEIPNEIFFEFAVVSNWAPDHLRTIKKLNRVGIKNILAEKPLCVSLYEIDQINSLVNTEKMNLVSHFQWSWSIFLEKLKKYQTKLEIGSITSIQVFGGAKCIVTNGIHFLSLAQILFEESIVSISANLDSQKINPRGNKFDFFEGTACWKFSGNKYLTISFTNNSHVSLKCVLIGKFGTFEISDNNLFANLIKTVDRIDITGPTRSKSPTEKYSLGFAFENHKGENGTDNIYKYLLNPNISSRKIDLSHDISVTKNLILSLIANERGQTLEPNNIALSDDEYKKEWDIT